VAPDVGRAAGINMWKPKGAPRDEFRKPDVAEFFALPTDCLIARWGLLT
jgi:hypothetical protein